MRNWRLGWTGPFAVVITTILGCADNPPKLHYIGEGQLQYYKETATEIEYPAVESCTVGEVMATETPRTVSEPREDQIRDLSLEEAIEIALQNSNIIRSATQLPSSNNPVLAGPDRISSIYDPAIQETGVLFGGRGLESALSSFDARWNTSMIWGRDERVQNNAFFSGGLTPGATLITETGAFDTRLQKVFGNGGTFAVTHNVNYQGVNTPGVLFSSNYTGNVGAEYRLPLWAGAGTEYTRIAGPIVNSFGGITGVNQGVVIARINNDITLSDFELSVRNLVKDVEDAYWDLYLQYRLYDTAVKTRNSTLDLWRYYKARDEAGADLVGGASIKPAEPQAREQYYETRAAVANALGGIYQAEVSLRRLMGLPSSDGLALRPSDEPPLAEYVPDWDVSLVESLTNRTELRRQKFNIKSLELQLQAANSLVRPRFDFVSNYRVNGFGDKLLSQKDSDGRSPQGLNSYYETITQGDQTGWNLGFEMTMDLGFRSAHAQVRNVEFRLAKAREVLAAQELDISHELTVAYQNLATNYEAAQANFNRLRASERRVEVLGQRETIDGYDERLRAELSRATSESQFYTNMSNYAKSIAAFHFAKGDLLEFNNVHLAESLWTPEAYHQAVRRAVARSHALGNPFLETEPEEFIYSGHDRVISVEPKPENSPGEPQLESLPADLSNPQAPLMAPPPAADEPTPVFDNQPTPAYEPPREDENGGGVSQSLEGTPLGTLKPTLESQRSPSHQVDREEFFKTFSSDEKNEPLQLDPQRDLLQ